MILGGIILKKINQTWGEVLISKGMDKKVADSLIGFISWNKGEPLSSIGKEINDVLNGYQGKIVAKDVVCSKYNDDGLLLFKEIISDEMANSIFETIMFFEQEEVYNTDDIH